MKTTENNQDQNYLNSFEQTNYPENIKAQLVEIRKIIKKHWFVGYRQDELVQRGYNVKNNVLMGSGGVGQIVELKNEYRIQISYGRTRSNYAFAVVIKK